MDKRQPVAAQVLAHSVYRRASRPVAITPLVIEQLPVERISLTEFTFTRYLPPFLMRYEGWSIFLDADMLVLGDIYELLDLASPNAAVSVVKNKLKFEWPSLMVFNNAECRALTPEYIETGNPQTMEWAEEVGDLPKEWNHCIGYDEPNPEAKLIHYTQGIPCFPEIRGCEYTDEWMAEAKASMSTVEWSALMANSVHAKPVLERLARANKAAD